MMADIPEFDVSGAEELEDDAIGSIDSKAQDFMMFGMQFLAVERGMKWILSEKIGLGSGFSLNRLGEFLEQSIERRRRREFEHDRLVDQLT
jgi:hypothetical protein